MKKIHWIGISFGLLAAFLFQTQDALAQAAIPAPDGTIHGCYHTRNGKVRIVDEGATCKKRELPITWKEGTYPINADTLDGYHADDFLRPCQKGTVWGRAQITGASVLASLSTTGVNSATAYNCTGNQVLVRRMATGTYQVVFDDGGSDADTIGIGTGAGPIPFVTATFPGGIIVRADGPYQCAQSPPPQIMCFTVFTYNNAGALVDASFSITIQ